MRGLTLPVLALAAAAAVLSGCGTVGEPGMAWNEDDGAAGVATLTYGVPNSDDLRLMMSCRPGAGSVRLTIVGRRKDGAVIELRSGKLAKRYGGAGTQDEETAGAMDIQVEVPASDPVLRRMAETGEIAIVMNNRRELDFPNAFGPAHDFLKACRAP
jgi:hypothetical protein